MRTIIWICDPVMYPRVKRSMTWINSKSKVQPKKQLKCSKCLFDFLLDYCNRSSLHGVRYIVEPGVHWAERLIWIILFVLSVVGAVVVSFMLTVRFQAAPTSTVVDTTNYPISNIPFPSVTICPKDRVDWQKALSIEKDTIPANDSEAIITYRRLLTELSHLDFGDFDDLAFLKNASLKYFYGLNVTKLLQDVVPSCSDLFSKCWWKFAERDCCSEIFELQKTEYGFCYSFNSDVAEFNGSKNTKESRPRRSSDYGVWSGLRVNVHLKNVSKPPESAQSAGVLMFVAHPGIWPNNAKSLATKMLASVSVLCSTSYATQRVLELDDSKRPCMFGKEKPYFREYCLSECRRFHTVKYCNCSPSFLFPKGSERDCLLEDFLCLIDSNDVFNNYISDDNVNLAPNDMPGITCNCPTECEVYGYLTETLQTPMGNYQDEILLDIHFQSSTMLRYRMDVVYTSLDLLVSFGGVVGLFLGASLLSAAELIYFVFIGLLRRIFRRQKVAQKSTEQSKIPVETISGILPLLDYPIKRYRHFETVTSTD